MTKVDIQNLISIFGTEAEFKKHIKEFVLDNVRRVDATPLDINPNELNHYWLDIEKELIFAICRTGAKFIEVTVTSFAEVQNIILRFKDYDQANTIFQLDSKLPAKFIENMQYDGTLCMTTY